jgi:hypothetical protein
MKYRKTDHKRGPNTRGYGKLAIVPRVARPAAPWSAATPSTKTKADTDACKVTDLQQIFPEVANRDTFRPKG